MRYRERNYEARITYLATLRQIVTARGSADVVYLDESGFAATTERDAGWAYRGKHVYGERSGKTRPRTSLIAGKRGKELLAPVLFQGTTTASWFTTWVKQHLLPELRPNSTLILDNAAFHPKMRMDALAQQYGHQVLFLPPYSPDFNPIEHVFAILKKRRMSAPAGTSLDQIVNSYGSLSP